MSGLRLKFLAAVFALAACLTAGLSGRAAETALVTTPSGPVAGLSANGVRSFKGVPYAKPPLGERRFAPPENIEPWTATRICDAFGPQPVQQDFSKIMGGPPAASSEDCLSLNIWTPAKAGGDKLPVYVFIHGGSFAVGSGASPVYDGTGLAKRGIVAVTINYRLNALGFLASGETFARYGTTGNWGHLDQIQALKWIRDNISAFGGDPERVTIGGESAGSFSVSALLLSPLANGLFRAAILESGTILSATTSTPYARADLHKAMAAGFMFANAFGADQDDAAGLAALRAADPEAMAQMSAFNPDFRITTASMFFPVFDGAVIPRHPYAALRRGEFNRVKVLFGFNADEGSVFVPPDIAVMEYKALAARMYGKRAPEVMARFASTGTIREQAMKAVMSGTFTAGMKVFADALARHGVDVYGYYFTHVSPQHAKAGEGAKHGAELPYIFDTFAATNEKDPTPEMLRLRDEIQTRFVNFIVSGDPNLGEEPLSGVLWPKYRAESPVMIRFDDRIRLQDMPDQDDAAFIAEVLESQIDVGEE